jgi:hypothetical protein
MMKPSPRTRKGQEMDIRTLGNRLGKECVSGSRRRCEGQDGSSASASAPTIVAIQNAAPTVSHYRRQGPTRENVSWDGSVVICYGEKTINLRLETRKRTVSSNPLRSSNESLRTAGPVRATPRGSNYRTLLMRDRYQIGRERQAIWMYQPDNRCDLAGIHVKHDCAQRRAHGGKARAAGKLRGGSPSGAPCQSQTSRLDPSG